MMLSRFVHICFTFGSYFLQFQEKNANIRSQDEIFFLYCAQIHPLMLGGGKHVKVSILEQILLSRAVNCKMSPLLLVTRGY